MKKKLVFTRQIGGSKAGRLIKSSYGKEKREEVASNAFRNVSIPSKYTTTFVERGR